VQEKAGREKERDVNVRSDETGLFIRLEKSGVYLLRESCAFLVLFFIFLTWKLVAYGSSCFLELPNK
jgi:hypothetical protein